VILRVPSADEVKAIGSAEEAAQQVQAQVEDRRGGRAATTRVASEADKPAPAAAGAKPAKSAAPAVAKAGSKRGDERLELVPPKAGRRRLAMADRPGAPGAGSSSANTEASRELARTGRSARRERSGQRRTQVARQGSRGSQVQERAPDLAQGFGNRRTPAKAQGVAVREGATAPAKPAGDTTAPTAVDKKDIWGDHAKTPAAAAPAPDAKPAETKPADAKPAAPAAST
jgi:pilus assembly protein FimV